MKKIDYALIFIVISLMAIGFLMLSSASIVIAQDISGSPYYYLKHQFLYGFIFGLLAFFLTFKINYRFWKKIALPILIISFVLVSLVFIKPFGVGFGGAKRWVNFAGFVFQPAEILKLSLVIYLAAWLSSKSDKEIKSLSRGFLPFLIIAVGAGFLLASQPDIGTLSILFAASLIIFFASGARIYHVILTVLFSLISLFSLIKIAPYRLNRLITFLNPQFDPAGISYQINQALIAIGSGGFWGLGLGQGRQKYYYLPEPTGDSIFAIIAEELGFVGASTIIALFVLLVWRAFFIAKNANDYFGKLLACGIGALIGTQAFINIGAMVGLFPLTGVPLPFISFGGTSLAMAMAAIGILINISRYS
ncbi:MAG: putative lipid II flippase FtsW [Parcubacteria group bacterium]|nr:putative lipid II flippase FtsW [Parcubacteria group bacterium]